MAGDERSEPPAHDGGWSVADPRVLATASGAVFAGLGRITQMVSQDGTSTYGYDSKSQLTSATHSYQSNETCTFDYNGNRTMSGYQTGTDNRLTNDGTCTYQYDAEGNRTRRTKTATGEVTEYEWDYRHRLVKVTEKNAQGTVTQVVEYVYDVFDRRISRKLDTTAPFDMANAVIERYVLDDIHNGLASADGGNVVLDFVDPDGSGAQPMALSKRYLYGEAVDQLFAQEDLSKTLGDAARNLWPLVDHLGTVRDLAKQDGTIAVHYKYDSFGRVTSGDTSKTRYLFTSREFDPATGLQSNRARWYDVRVGRWISEDPLGFVAGDGNLGRYVRNESTRMVDPSGLWPPDDGHVGPSIGPIPPEKWRPPLTADEKRLIAMAKGDPELIRKILIMITTLRRTELWFGPDRCHRWCRKFFDQYDRLPYDDVLFPYPDYEMPLCVGGWPGWKDHGVIMIVIDTKEVYLDRGLQGDSDHIAFEKHPVLIYPGDPGHAEEEAKRKAAEERAKKAMMDSYSKYFAETRMGAAL